MALFQLNSPPAASAAPESPDAGALAPAPPVEPPAPAAPRTVVAPEPEPEPEPELAAPRILSAPLTYPAGGRGEAEVLLELIVGRDGTVRSASVERGPEPFASAALEAVRDFRFEPARRGGQPVPARIRFEVKYVPPPEPLVTP
ncbi:MAG: hypothetical protein RL033_4622, partial [Pseudomonadota bacterium]